MLIMKKQKRSKLILKAIILLGCMVFLYLNNFFDGTETVTFLQSHNERQLSVYLGNGKCKWQPPDYDVPDNIDFYKTVIAGFPSGDKRLTFIQMEALTGWPAKDEWYESQLFCYFKSFQALFTHIERLPFDRLMHLMKSKGL